MYKALVPVAVGAILTALSYTGITGEMTVEEALYVLGAFTATALGVWATPNKK